MTFTSGIDAGFNGEVFRRDYKVVIAMKREMAIIRPVRLAPKVGSGDYVAGQVLAKYGNTAGNLEGLFVDYDDAGASGRETAQCILLSDVKSEPESSAASGRLGLGLFSGFVLKASLIGFDNAAGTDLKASEWSDAQGVDIVKIR
jgi:hypothetical protein